ncbi:MAG: radical SAM protein [Anaerolineaceae bacterium]|nr:radical SAM protein [Anaerolineaceae bacterium]
MLIERFSKTAGGVTISGGDPLFFPEFTLELAKRLKNEDLHVGLETSCFQKWEKIQSLVNYIDLFIVDIKSLDPKKHKAVIGWPLEPILENIKKLIELKANIRIHLPIIPDFNDSMDDFATYTNFLAPLADRLNGIDILPYHVYGEGKYRLLGRHDTYQYKGVKELSTEKIKLIAKTLRQAHIKSLTVGGLVGMGNKPET